jgi:5-(carboxyamino)imidazole ribonucleotide synthase
MAKILNKKPGLKLGILGGGQLARMLALAAHPYGILPSVYAANSDEPAAQVTPFLFQGKADDAKSLESFLRNCDVVTFESEFLNAELLAQLSAKTQTPIFPEPKLMGQLQDRLSQKQLLQKYKIPTAPYGVIKDHKDVHGLRSLGGEIVVKQRRFGYDGYGTFFVSTTLVEQDWKKIASKTSEGFIGEQKIAFKRELALLMARDQSGKIIDFPLVESKQTNARCDWVMGPIRHPQEAALRRSLRRFLNKENYVGLIAFELFDTGKTLLVNEIAPRVHNSGHYSQNALSLSQFQAHVLAVCGYKLFAPQVLSAFAMANLLGASSDTPHWSEQMANGTQQVQWHWYGKKDNRLHRKMGHLNAIGSTPKAALKTALAARRKVQL